MKCNDCSKKATSMEVDNTGKILKYLCDNHAFSFDSSTKFVSISSLIPQPLYNQIIANVPIVCIDVAIIYNNKVLLIKRRDKPAAGEWWLPGGRLYKGESLEACAIRKAKEETGLHCRIGPMVHYQATDFGTVHSVNFCYVLTASDDTVRLDDTCLDYEWVAGMRYGLNDYVVNCLARAFDWLYSGVSVYEA